MQENLFETTCTRTLNSVLLYVVKLEEHESCLVFLNQFQNLFPTQTPTSQNTISSSKVQRQANIEKKENTSY